jgi:hypothetical protein
MSGFVAVATWAKIKDLCWVAGLLPAPVSVSVRDLFAQQQAQPLDFEYLSVSAANLIPTLDLEYLSVPAANLIPALDLEYSSVPAAKLIMLLDFD